MEAPDLEGGRGDPFLVPHSWVRPRRTGLLPGTVNWQLLIGGCAKRCDLREMHSPPGMPGQRVLIW